MLIGRSESESHAFGWRKASSPSRGIGGYEVPWLGECPLDGFRAALNTRDSGAFIHEGRWIEDPHSDAEISELEAEAEVGKRIVGDVIHTTNQRESVPNLEGSVHIETLFILFGQPYAPDAEEQALE